MPRQKKIVIGRVGEALSKGRVVIGRLKPEVTAQLPLAVVAGRVIRALRKKDRRDQHQLSAAAGMSRSTLAALETGRATPNLAHLFTLGRALRENGSYPEHGFLDILDDLVSMLRAHGVRVVSGTKPDDSGLQIYPTHELDALATLAVTRWLDGLARP